VRLQLFSSQLAGKLRQLPAEKFTVGWLVQKLNIFWLVTKKGQIKYYSTS
jgi:hypothetical protein